MKKLVAVVLLALCSACAPVIPRVEYTGSEPIRKIAILSVVPPRNVRIVYKAYLPLPGPATEASDVRESSAYVAQMNARNKILAPELAEYLKQELGKRYEVVFVNRRPKANTDGTLDYSSIKVDADAILQVYYGTTGYILFRAEADYFPLFDMVATMVDARTYKTLYRKGFLVQPGEAWGDMYNREVVQADRRYAYRNGTHIVESFDESYKGLVEAQESLARLIVRDLTVSPKK